MAGIFRGWFRLRERCPACGVRLEREAGSFTGAWLVSFAITLTLMISPLMLYVFWRGVTGDAIAFLPFAVCCIAAAVAVPPVAYPFASSGWAAIDLAMRPLDPEEEAEATLHATNQQVG